MLLLNACILNSFMATSCKGLVSYSYAKFFAYFYTELVIYIMLEVSNTGILY